VNARSIDDAERDLLAMIGRHGPPVAGCVTARDIHRFAVACGDEDPVYSSEEAARDAGFAGIPAPPLMLTGTLEWGAGPPLTGLRVDGSGVGRESWLPLDGLRLMGGGQDVTFHGDVLAGTSFAGDVVLEAVQRKDGSSPLLLLTITTEYRTVGGEPLATCRETLIAR
jgi:acyl dehydratase